MRIVSMLLVNEVVTRSDGLSDLIGAPCEWWLIDDVPGTIRPNFVVVLDGDVKRADTMTIKLTGPAGTVGVDHEVALPMRTSTTFIDGAPHYTTVVGVLELTINKVGPYSLSFAIDANQILGNLRFGIGLNPVTVAPNSLPTGAGS